MSLMLMICAACTDADREQVQSETAKQEKYLDQIGDVLGDLKRLGVVSACLLCTSCAPVPCRATSLRQPLPRQ